MKFPLKWLSGLRVRLLISWLVIRAWCRGLFLLLLLHSLLPGVKISTNYHNCCWVWRTNIIPSCSLVFPRHCGLMVRSVVSTLKSRMNGTSPIIQKGPPYLKQTSKKDILDILRSSLCDFFFNSRWSRGQPSLLSDLPSLSWLFFFWDLLISVLVFLVILVGRFLLKLFSHHWRMSQIKRLMRQMTDWQS